MSKQSRLTAKEGESLLLTAGFQLLRTRGSHRIYERDDKKIIIPFHSGKILHPKVVKQILIAINTENR